MNCYRDKLNIGPLFMCMVLSMLGFGVYVIISLYEFYSVKAKLILVLILIL